MTKILRKKAEPVTGSPHRCGHGSRLSAAYTAGRQGADCPRWAAVTTSATHKAWLVGHREGMLEQVTANGDMVYDRTGGYLCKCTSYADAAALARMLNGYGDLVTALRRVMRFALPITPADVEDFYAGRAALSKARSRYLSQLSPTAEGEKS